MTAPGGFGRMLRKEDQRYSARDALELIDVEYEPLPAVIDARRALDPGAPVVRDDLEQNTGRPGNHIFDWETCDAARTEQVFRADGVELRIHPTGSAVLRTRPPRSVR